MISLKKSMFRFFETGEDIYNSIYVQVLSHKLASFLIIVVVFLSRKIVILFIPGGSALTLPVIFEVARTFREIRAMFLDAVGSSYPD